MYCVVGLYVVNVAQQSGVASSLSPQSRKTTVLSEHQQICKRTRLDSIIISLKCIISRLYFFVVIVCCYIVVGLVCGYILIS